MYLDRFDIFDHSFMFVPMQEQQARLDGLEEVEPLALPVTPDRPALRDLRETLDRQDPPGTRDRQVLRATPE